MKLSRKALSVLFLCIVLAVGMSTMSFALEADIDMSAVDMKGAVECIIILVISFALFFTEALPLGVTAMLVPVALSFPGIEIISGKTAFANFGEQWVVTFMAMFIVGDAIFKTGLAAKIGDAILKVAGKTQKRLVLIMGATLGIMSAFLSNSATMALFAPVIVAAAKEAGLKPSKVIMPMAFLICIGGNMTLMGASSKGVVNGLMETYGVEGFSFFDYTPLGICFFVVALLYFALVGVKLLPDRDVTDADSTMTSNEKIEYNTAKMPIAAAVFVVMIVAIALNWVKPATGAMLGMCIVVATGCISMKDAYRAVNWNTIFLFAGMLALGDALVKTGADVLIAAKLLGMASSPTMALLVVFVATCIITNFMSNTAAAAVATPIAITAGNLLGVSPLPFCMAVGIGASLCFLTPVATPSNTIAYGLGGYKFSDFAKCGGLLELIMIIEGCILIPIFFPF